jgi:hypothetical protein
LTDIRQHVANSQFQHVLKGSSFSTKLLYGIKFILFLLLNTGLLFLVVNKSITGGLPATLLAVTLTLVLAIIVIRTGQLRNINNLLAVVKVSNVFTLAVLAFLYALDPLLNFLIDLVKSGFDFSVANEYVISLSLYAAVILLVFAVP